MICLEHPIQDVKCILAYSRLLIHIEVCVLQRIEQTLQKLFVVIDRVPNVSAVVDYALIIDDKNIE